MGHAEQVPLKEVNSTRTEVYYLPMHTVHKEDSTSYSVQCVCEDCIGHFTKQPSAHWANNAPFVG